MNLKVNIVCLLGLFLLSFGLQAQDVKKVEVQVNEKDGLKKITIRKHLEDGSLDVISWEGEGEVPEDIKKHLNQGGKHMIFIKEGKTIEVLGGDDDDSKEIEVIVKGVEKEGQLIKRMKFIGDDGEEVEKEFEVILKGVEGQEGAHKLMKVIVEKEEGDELEKEVKVEVIVIDDAAHKVLKQNDKNVMIFRTEEGENIEIKVNGEEVELEGDEIQWTAAELPEMQRTLALENFSVAPNPARKELNLSFKAAKAPLSVRIFDQSGRQVYRAFIRDFDGLFQDSIDIRDVSADILFITIEQEGKAYTEKIAVAK